MAVIDPIGRSLRSRKCPVRGLLGVCAPVFLRFPESERRIEGAEMPGWVSPDFVITHTRGLITGEDLEPFAVWFLNRIGHLAYGDFMAAQALWQQGR